jgi:hypothetical protein
MIAMALMSMLSVDSGGLITAAPTPGYVHRTSKHSHARRKKLLRKGGWAGAGFAAGRVAGPAGSAAVGVAKYRHDLKAGGRRRTKAVAKIGAPIAAGVVAGPAGTAGYEAVEHRGWIKRHILHLKPHRPKQG